MSSTVASQLARTATSHAAAQAAQRRSEAGSGFHTLVDRDDDDDTATAASHRRLPESVKPRSPAAVITSAACKTLASASGDPVPAGSSAAQQTAAANLPNAAGQTASGAAGPGPQPGGPTAGGAPTRPATPLPAAPAIGSPATQPSANVLVEADEEAGGTGESPPSGAQATAQASASTGAASATTASPSLAAGSAAQPLMSAVNGTGATLIKAQAASTGTGLRTGAAGAARAKGGSTLDTVGATTVAPTLGVALAETGFTPILPAADDGPDDPGDGSASDDGGSAGADGAAAATGQGGFAPAAGPQLQTPSSTPAAATPMTASAADLAAQMAAKVVSGSSRFQLQLNPLGLGRVDVSVSIGSDRQLTAALSFADPQTASALSAHAGELKTALEQAGFNVPAGGFDFTSNATGALGANLQGGFGADTGSGGGQNGGAGSSGGAGRLAAFSAGEALASGGATDSTARSAGGDSRLDIRI